jgi:uncharacterized protein (UPF0276 family)
MVGSRPRIGIGFRTEIAAEILSGQTPVDHLELLFEERNSSSARAREGVALGEMFPIVLHGTKLSLGSAEGIDESRAARLGSYAKKTRAFAITEHAAFVRASGVEIGHLSPVPFSREAARVLKRNVERARRHFPDVPLLLENVAWPLRPRGDEMDEGAFHSLVVEETGCDLLLDLGNLLANAKNRGDDPYDLLAKYPVERAAMIHIAGSITLGGFTYDTHAHAVPEEVFGLLDPALARAGDVPIVLERDHGFETSVLPELERARASSRGAAPRLRAVGSAPHGAEHHEAAPLAPPSASRLADEQAALARALAGLDAADDVDTAGVARAREILVRKRVEELLPLLPRLRDRNGTATLAHEQVLATARPQVRAAIADARAVASRAANDPLLADAARLDGLALDARFSFDDRGAVPRRAPFVGSVEISRGRCYALRGFGTEAQVHFFVRG